MNALRDAASVVGAVVGTVAFEDIDQTYYSDSCVPLAAAADEGRVELKALARGHYPGTPLAEASVEGIRTLGYWDAPTAQDWGLAWHRNEGIELSYLEKGNAAFAVDERAWDLRAGHVIVTRPWQRHRIGDPNVTASRLHWVIIDVDVRRPNQPWRWPDWVALAPHDLERLTRLLQHNEHAVWTASPSLGEAFVAATALVDAAGPASESDLRIRISMLLLELLKTLELEELQLDDSLTAPRRGVRIFLQDLESCSERKWTLPAMAASCSMGRTQFTRLCQELTNMTPIEYLTHLRIERAKSLLASTGHSVTDVATVCGFETSQYFATRFRAIAGVAPAQYRALRRSSVATAS